MIFPNVRTSLVGLLLILAVALAGCRREGPRIQQSYPQTKYVSREGEVGGQKFRYRVYVPPNLKPDERAAVMLYLHGAGNRGDDNESQLNGLAEVIDGNRDKFNFIVVIPQCPADRFWDEHMIGRAIKALDDTVLEFNADKNRLYVAGFSLGGYGAWTTAAMFTDKFAAVVPMSGRILPRSQEIKYLSPEIAELAKSSEPYESFAEKIGHVPVWIFHGTADNVVPIDDSRQMVNAMLNAGNANLKFSEVAGAGHEPLGFKDPELFLWLAKQNRLPSFEDESF